MAPRHRRQRLRLLTLLALLACLWSAPTHAGELPPRANELSLGWAPRLVLRRDQIASPRLYVGPGLAAAELRYARTKGPNAHRLELEFLKATLRSQPDFEYLRWPDGEPVTTEGSPLTYVRLAYAYLRAIPTPQPQRLALRLGPALDFDIQQLDWVHHPFGLGGYFGAFALDAAAQLDVSPAPRHRLRATASVPLFAWIARSPYGINDEQQLWANRDHNGAKTFFRYLANGRMQTWNHYQAVRVELRYDLRLADHWALTFDLFARIFANQVPRPVLGQEYGGALAITAKF